MHVTEHGLEHARGWRWKWSAALAGGLVVVALVAHEAPAQAPAWQNAPAAATGPALGSPAASAPSAPDWRELAGRDQAAPRLVAEVRIVGNRGVQESKVYAQIRTRKDREFDPETLQGDVRRLVSTSLFQDVRTYLEETPAGVIVTFEVLERPIIRYIKFVGNRGITDKTLDKKSGLKVGESLNAYAVSESRNKLEDFYRTKGYTKVQISVLEGDDAKDQGVVFIVNEGNLERIGAVEFVGNTIADDSRLKTQIQSKPGFLYYFFKGRVDRKKIDEDVEKLTAYYRGLGYFRARIGRELDYNESGEWLTLRFVIDEGPRYVVRNVSLAGNEKFSEEELAEKLNLKSGEYFNLAKMNRDVSTIRDEYGAQGHIYADVVADPRFLEEPGELDLIYKIKEGEVYRVGKINVHIGGEFPHTQQSVVMDRLSVRPGQIIDLRELRNSERRLKSSQLFKSDPQTGEEPRIIIPPPKIDDIAERPHGPSIRGQSPEPAMRQTAHYEPKEIDLDVYVVQAEPAPSEPPPPTSSEARYREPVYRVSPNQWQPEYRPWPPR
jgi:outer membrane protein insertion porin family